MKNRSSAPTSLAAVLAVTLASSCAAQNRLMYYQNTSFDSERDDRRCSIDVTKYKTKMCRNYMLGLPCPFEDRCAFAHGNGQIRSNRSSNQGSPSKAPPTYNAFLLATDSPVDSPRSNSPHPPPSYPSRFRFDPYSAQGIVFEE